MVGHGRRGAGKVDWVSLSPSLGLTFPLCQMEITTTVLPLSQDSSKDQGREPEEEREEEEEREKEGGGGRKQGRGRLNGS